MITCDKSRSNRVCMNNPAIAAACSDQGLEGVKGGVNLDRFGGAKIDQLAGIQGFSWDGWNGAWGAR